MDTFDSIAPFVIIVAAGAVVAVLLLGVFSMAKGGEFNRKYGNLLMRWRVGLQALAIVLLAIMWILFKD